MKKIDKSQLAESDGAEGRPAWVAVNGKVYDVGDSALWEDGTHLRTHQAGQDLSEAVKAAPHGLEVLERVIEVGEIAEAPPAPDKQPPKAPALLQAALDQHPHPISVHFPIALSLTACALFVASLFFRGRDFKILSLIVSGEAFELMAVYGILFAALVTPVTIFTGWASWRYNYNSIWTRIYRGKILLSVVLVGLQWSALGIRVLLVDYEALSGPLYWVYGLLVLAMGPTVMGLGYLGGLITFPR